MYFYGTMYSLSYLWCGVQVSDGRWSLCGDITIYLVEERCDGSEGVSSWVFRKEGKTHLDISGGFWSYHEGVRRDWAFGLGGITEKWKPTEILRFCKYLGLQYEDKRNVSDETGMQIPIVTIYILGCIVGDLWGDETVVYVIRQYLDYDSSKIR